MSRCGAVFGRLLVLRWLAFWALAVFGVAGCVFGGDEVLSREERIKSDLQAEANAVGGVQARALADETVTYAEYEAAVFRAIGCIRSEGISVDGPTPDPFDPHLLQFAYGGVSGKAGIASAEAAHDRCYEEHLSVVDQAYSFQNRRTPGEQAELDHAVADCMVERGVLSVDASQEEFEQARNRDFQTFTQCRITAAAGR